MSWLCVGLQGAEYGVWFTHPRHVMCVPGTGAVVICVWVFVYVSLCLCVCECLWVCIFLCLLVMCVCVCVCIWFHPPSLILHPELGPWVAPQGPGKARATRPLSLGAASFFGRAWALALPLLSNAASASAPSAKFQARGGRRWRTVPQPAWPLPQAWSREARVSKSLPRPPVAQEPGPQLPVQGDGGTAGLSQPPPTPPWTHPLGGSLPCHLPP